jgi:hypothetical protein
MRWRWRVAALAVAWVFTACDGEKAGPGGTPVGRSAASASTSGQGAVQPTKASAGKLPKTKSSARPAASTATKSTSEARYEKLTDEEVKSDVKPHLGKKEKLAHPPFRGPYGPGLDTIVVVTQKDNGDFGGFVLADRGGKTKRIDLPVLKESWPGESVDAVSFLPQCDGDPEDELVVVSRHRAGKGTATVVSAFDFDGDGFRRLADVEALAARAKTVADVRELLEERTFIIRIDGVPVRILPTSEPKALRTRLAKLMGVEPKEETDTELRFDFAEGKDIEPARFVFTFNDRKVLRKVTIVAVGPDASKRNPTGRKLARWLRTDAGEGEAKEKKTTWQHHGWTFVLDSDSERNGFDITPDG